MRAVILAGGKGRRLYPYTTVIPKPLVPLGETPIIEIVVRQLAAQGFTHITMAVGHQAQLIMAVMGDGSKWGVSIDYSLETEPLNTIGPLTLVENLDETFLVMNGDLLTDLRFGEVLERHKLSGAIATVASCKRHVQLSLGVLQTRDDFITGFREKPTFDYDVSMGIYAFEPRIFDYIPNKQPFGFDHLMETLLAANEKIAVYPFNGHWLDMGTPEDLENAMQEFENNKTLYLPGE